MVGFVQSLFSWSGAHSKQVNQKNTIGSIRFVLIGCEAIHELALASRSKYSPTRMAHERSSEQRKGWFWCAFWIGIPFYIWPYFHESRVSCVRAIARTVQMMVFTHVGRAVCLILILLWLGVHNKQVIQESTLVPIRFAFLSCEDCNNLALKKKKRREIILLEVNASAREILRRLNCIHRSITRLAELLHLTNSTDNHPWSGRPRVTTPQPCVTTVTACFTAKKKKSLMKTKMFF